MGRQMRTQDKQCLLPFNWDPNLQIQASLPAANPCQVPPIPGSPPGLQELLKVPAPRVLRVGLLPPTAILRVAPPTSGSILSTAVLQQLGYVFWGEGDRQRGQKIQARGSLCWHTALEFTTHKQAFHEGSGCLSKPRWAGSVLPPCGHLWGLQPGLMGTAHSQTFLGAVNVTCPQDTTGGG